VLQEYFYGLTNELSPHANIVNFSDLLIYRFGGPQAPRSALPIGAEPSADPTRVAPVTITIDLVHAVLAVSSLSISIILKVAPPEKNKINTLALL